MLAFLLALGLTLIFGMMDYLNLAHGAFYTIGAYAGFSVARFSGSFWLALAVAFLVPALLGALFQYFMLKPLVRGGRSTHLDIALFTLGLSFAVIGVVEMVYGAGYDTIATPGYLSGSVSVFGVGYPTYRLFIIALGVAVGAGVWLVMDRSTIGATVRAAVDDHDMTVGMGVNVDRLFALVFGFGAGLAGLAGAVAAPVLSVYSHMGMDILILTLIVVIAGGLGSIMGSFVAALAIGLINTFAQAYLPGLESFAMYIFLALILAFNPGGFFRVARSAG
ncbi:branched-chain amino acid ABC transporter permease [Rhizobiales bacterium L72]|uniref:Branched-chain amino acid ABC transporter permease n=2 Tax=Propylenella binzhouense TaxID=2555902 RepID=A0A964T2C5_9HYPH|nr:branched-chain amino acid ABC transporter permease [Propylenella binzhouense]